MVCPLSPYFLYDILDTILSLVWPLGSPVITEGLVVVAWDRDLSRERPTTGPRKAYIIQT